MLPDYMRPYYDELFFKSDEDAYLWKLVKAADKLSAYIKCIQEVNAGNKEFEDAKISTETIIEELDIEEVKIFKEEFLASYGLTLDKLKME